MTPFRRLGAKRTSFLVASTLLLCACRGHRHNYAPRPADPDPPAPGMNPYDDPVDAPAAAKAATTDDAVDDASEPKLGQLELDREGGAKVAAVRAPRGRVFVLPR